MIITSRVTNKFALEVFESFQKDRTLPKFRQTQVTVVSDNGVQQKGRIYNDANVPMEPDEQNWSLPTINIASNGHWANGDSKEWSGGWKTRLVRTIVRDLGITRKVQVEVYGKSNPLDVLLSVRGSLQEAKDYSDRMKSYDAAIQAAKQGGQAARVDKLLKAKQIVQHESVLIATGFKQYLTEPQVIEFAKKCQKGLRLDWVANFGRPIPPNVLTRKVEADALKVFDNYVVLHYDPQAKAFELTPAQVAAKRDPILFGVIADVRKLYFIGDWKDDECDLTMEEVAKVLGHGADEISQDPTIA